MEFEIERLNIYGRMRPNLVIKGWVLSENYQLLIYANNNLFATLIGNKRLISFNHKAKNGTKNNQYMFEYELPLPLFRRNIKIIIKESGEEIFEKIIDRSFLKIVKDIIRNIKHENDKKNYRQLLKRIKKTNNGIVLVSHDSFNNGAQILLLNIAKEIKRRNMDVIIFTRKDGILFDDYQDITYTFNIEKKASFERILATLQKKGYNKAILNTVVNGDLVKPFKEHNFKVVSLIHELPGVIKHFNCVNKAADIIKYADYIVFPSNYVLEKFKTLTKVNREVFVKPQGKYMNAQNYNKKSAKSHLLKANGINKDKYIIMGAGFGNERKGIDLFYKIAKAMTRHKNLLFIWIGDLDSVFTKNLNFNSLKNLLMPGFIKDQDEYLKFNNACDIFLLTSREDPFPSVVMEAMDASVPVIGFKDAGGFADIIEDNHNGYLVDFEDIEAMMAKISMLVNNPNKLAEIGNNAHDTIKKYSFKDYISYLINLFEVK